MKFPMLLIYEDGEIVPISSGRELDNHIALTPSWRQASHYPEDCIVDANLEQFRFCADDEMEIAFELMGNYKFYKVDNIYNHKEIKKFIADNHGKLDRESTTICNQFVEVSGI